MITSFSHTPLPSSSTKLSARNCPSFPPSPLVKAKVLLSAFVSKKYKNVAKAYRQLFICRHDVSDDYFQYFITACFSTFSFFGGEGGGGKLSASVALTALSPSSGFHVGPFFLVEVYNDNDDNDCFTPRTLRKEEKGRIEFRSSRHDQHVRSRTQVCYVKGLANRKRNHNPIRSKAVKRLKKFPSISFFFLAVGLRLDPICPKRVSDMSSRILIVWKFHISPPFRLCTEFPNFGCQLTTMT